MTGVINFHRFSSDTLTPGRCNSLYHIEKAVAAIKLNHNKINQYSVTAISDVEVCYIDISAFRQFLKEAEQFAFEIILDLCKDELESIRRCANRTQKQTRGNIADVILEFADHLYESDSFTLPVSQADIGNLVDTSRESVSRIFSEFHRDEILNIKGRKIEILNKKSLQLISQNG